MSWDSSRPVPWARLVRDWVIYVGIMTIVLLIVYRDRLTPGLFAGLFISGPIFVALGALLAKFGYQRKTLKDLRSEATARSTRTSSPTASAGSSPARPKPAPTKRTSTGAGRPGTKRRR